MAAEGLPVNVEEVARHKSLVCFDHRNFGNDEAEKKNIYS